MKTRYIPPIIIIITVLMLCSCTQGSAPAPAQTEPTTEAPAPAQTEPTTEATAPDEADEPATISIIMVGDILLHDPIEALSRDEEGDYDYHYIFEQMKDEIADADIAIVNQEVIIGGKELGISGYPAFNAPYDIADALYDTGFDVVCHATNHAMDKGSAGVHNAMDYWEETYPDITITGVNDSAAAQDVLHIVEKDGIRIAVLNYTYGTNGIALPANEPFLVNLLDEDQVISDLYRAESEADFTIVCPHWGIEYALSPSDSQERWDRIFYENGADLVIGTHPHVIEPISVIGADEASSFKNNHGDGNGSMLTYYSLGNFVNWTSESGAGIANRMVGGMAEVSLSRDDSGEVCISDYGVRALVCHLSHEKKDFTVYPLSDYDEALASQNAICAQDGGFSYQYCIDLCDKVWGAGNWH